MMDVLDGAINDSGSALSVGFVTLAGAAQTLLQTLTPPAGKRIKITKLVTYAADIRGIILRVNGANFLGTNTSYLQSEVSRWSAPLRWSIGANPAASFSDITFKADQTITIFNDSAIPVDGIYLAWQVVE